MTPEDPMIRAPHDSRSPALPGLPPRPSPDRPARAAARRLTGALLACVALNSCSSQPSGGPEKASPDTLATASAPSANVSGPAARASARTSAQAPAQASARPVRDLAPPGAGASREEREKAALDLLSGKAHAADLPLTDTDPGADFEPLLRFALQSPMSIRPGKVAATGLEEAAVAKAVEAKIPRLRLCYAEGLRKNPALQGRVAARVVVTAPGKPLSVEDAHSDVPDSSVVRCVLLTLSNIDYPPPFAPQGSVTIPFLLTPE